MEDLVLPTEKTSKIMLVNDTRLRSSSVSSVPSLAPKPKRKSTSLPIETVEYLKNWMMSPEHIAHPYPTEQEKAKIMKDTGIELKQLTNWFVNNRKRFWKPRVEARLQEQAKARTPVSPVVAMNASEVMAPSSPVADRAIVHVVSTPNVETMTDDVAIAREEPVVGSTSSRDRAIVSPGRAISEASSSETESVGLNVENDESSEAPDEEEFISCKELVDVHILRPVGIAPTLDDVSVSSTVRRELILRTFMGCEISYSISKKDESERNTEIQRVKGRCLEQYLEENKQPKVSKRRASDSACVAHTRKKFRKSDITSWKEACRRASSGYCESLPTLDEASFLFGFS